jgi:hypothetical protein
MHSDAAFGQAEFIGWPQKRSNDYVTLSNKNDSKEFEVRNASYACSKIFNCGRPDLLSYAHVLASIEAAHYCKVLHYVGRKPNVFGLARYCPRDALGLHPYASVSW